MSARVPLLLLPGLLCDATAWPQARMLDDVAECHVPSWGTLDSLAAMARHALDTAPAERFAVVGHSMGGRVALEMLRLAPERVERLALADSGSDPLLPGEAGERERAGRLALVQVAREQGLRAMGVQWARGMVHPQRLDSPLFAEILDMIERRSLAVFEAQQHALLNRPDARGVLAGATCPVMLLCGRQDAWSPLERHERMRDDLQPRAVVVPVEDAGHMAPMEQPEAVAQALRQWLQQPAA